MKGIKGFQKGHKVFGGIKTRFNSETSKKFGFKKGHKINGAKGKHWKIQLDKIKNMSRGRGSKNPLWKGGVSRDTHSLSRPEYKIWRKSVFERDNYTCKLKSLECISKIEAHHIYRWADYPELRYIINNGITLCKFHHPLKKSEEKRMIPIFQELLLTKN